MLGERCTVINDVERWDTRAVRGIVQILGREMRDRLGDKGNRAKQRRRSRPSGFATQKGCSGVWGKTWTLCRCLLQWEEQTGWHKLIKRYQNQLRGAGVLQPSGCNNF